MERPVVIIILSKWSVFYIIGIWENAKNKTDLQNSFDDTKLGYYLISDILLWDKRIWLLLEAIIAMNSRIIEYFAL